MTALTRNEWETRILDAYPDNPCPHCGWDHPAVDVDECGAVWFWCPVNDQAYYAGTEPVPVSFAPEPDYPDDLPF